MVVTCESCQREYDDVDCWTFCPHALFMQREDLDRKKAAIELLGREVRFAHMPEAHPLRVQSISWNGMVSIAGMVGEFAPHLFVKVG